LVIGDLFDDPGIVTAQNVLPSLGYVMLVFGAVIPAVAVMVGSSRLGLYPQWFVWVTPMTAVLLIVTASSVSSIALLPIWVAAAAVLQSRTNQTPLQHLIHATMQSRNRITLVQEPPLTDY